MKRNWFEIITLVGSIIGALAWLPFVWDIAQKPDIKGRLIGMSISGGSSFSYDDPRNNSRIEIKGIAYYPKLVLTALNRDFNVKTIEVYVKYPNDSQTYKGITFYSSEHVMPVKTKNGETKTKILKIPPSEHVALLTVLEHGRVTTVFIPFIVDKGTFSFFSEIEFKFYDYEDKTRSFIVKKEDMDIPNTLYEEQYWTEVSQ